MWGCRENTYVSIWLEISEQRNLRSGSKNKLWYLKDDWIVRHHPERFTSSEIYVYSSEEK